MKKVYFRFQAITPIKNEKREILRGRVEALNLGKTKERFEKRGFRDFQYWIEDNECQRNEKTLL